MDTTSPSETCISCLEAEAKLQCKHCKDFFICSRACAEEHGVSQEMHVTGDCVSLVEGAYDDRITALEYEARQLSGKAAMSKRRGKAAEADSFLREARKKRDLAQQLRQSSLNEQIGDNYKDQIDKWLYQSQHAATEAERTRAAQWVKYYVEREKATGGRYGYYRPPGWDPNYRYGLTSEKLVGVEWAQRHLESATYKASEARRLQMERGLAMEIGEDEEEFIDRSYATEIAYYQRILDDPRSTPSAKAHAQRRIALFYAKQGGR